MASATHHSTCHVVGTGPYMPPEYMQMGHVSPKTDTYAYGVVLLELLSGLPAADPVTRQTLANTMGAVVEDPKRLLKGALDARAGKWDSKASRSLAKVACSCLEPRSDRRCTVTQMLETIDKIAGREERSKHKTKHGSKSKHGDDIV